MQTIVDDRKKEKPSPPPGRILKEGENPKKRIAYPYLKKDLIKLNDAIKAVMKLSPEVSVVLGVEEFGDMISELETSKVELCERMGKKYKSKWKLKKRKKIDFGNMTL